MKLGNMVRLLAILGLALPVMGTEAQPEQTNGGFEFKDSDQDGVNDNLVKDLDQVTGQAFPDQAGAPVDPKGGRQEARGRYRHGYHGQELERARNLHQHDQGQKP